MKNQFLDFIMNLKTSKNNKNRCHLCRNLSRDFLYTTVGVLFLSAPVIDQFYMRLTMANFFRIGSKQPIQKNKIIFLLYNF